jgi:hypothetical protein
MTLPSTEKLLGLSRQGQLQALHILDRRRSRQPRPSQLAMNELAPNQNGVRRQLGTASSALAHEVPARTASQAQISLE